jgi:hypothetical protein
MKITVLNVVMLSTGIVLIYSAIKNLDPREVAKSAIKGEAPKPAVVQGDDGRRSGGGTFGGTPQAQSVPDGYTVDQWSSVVQQWQNQGGLKFQ